SRRSPSYLVLPTTPTTSQPGPRGRVLSSDIASSMCRPSGLELGKKRRAKVSLMMTGMGAAAGSGGESGGRAERNEAAEKSAPEKSRPASKGMRKDSKNLGPTGIKSETTDSFSGVPGIWMSVSHSPPLNSAIHE